jgi:hypothetical protein
MLLQMHQITHPFAPELNASCTMKMTGISMAIITLHVLGNIFM